MNKRTVFIIIIICLIIGAGLTKGMERIFSESRYIKKTDRMLDLSFSQFGEDIIMNNIIIYLNIKNPTYIDIGAAHPFYENNTYMFYKNGGHGVLVEPNPRFVKQLKEVRSRDTVLGVGVGATDEKAADYYMVGSDGVELNTFSKEFADNLTKKADGNNLKVLKKMKIPLVSINKILSQYFKEGPDIFSIDTEGMDYDILKSLDFNKHRPKIICVETFNISNFTFNEKIIDLLISKNYRLIGGTLVNSIFVDKDAMQNVKR